MNATTMNFSPVPRLLLSILVVSILIAMAAVSVHAIAKHGQAALVASQCADFPEFRMINPLTGRIASICLTDEGWGVAITESDGQAVTSFIKEKAKRIEQVIQYLRNAGYQTK